MFIVRDIYCLVIQVDWMKWNEIAIQFPKEIDILSCQESQWDCYTLMYVI